MRQAYYEYAEEHPEEMKEVLSLIRSSEAIEIARQNRIDEKLALIQRCREELSDETRYERS